jgi:hypothetical protein
MEQEQRRDLEPEQAPEQARPSFPVAAPLDTPIPLDQATPEPVLFDPIGAGIGDVCCLAWIAEGAKAIGRTLAFVDRRGTSHRDDAATAALEILGQTFVPPTPGAMPLVHGGELYKYELRVRGTLIPKTFLWQNALPVKCQPVRPTWVLRDEDFAAAQSLLDWCNPHGGPVLILSPYSTVHLRNWPLHKWLRLAWMFHRRGVGTLAVHSGVKGLEKFPHYAGGLPLRTTAACILRAHAVVGNDSGIAHLAGTLGVRSFPLMGPTDPVCVYGYAPEFHPIRVAKERVACVGCHFKQDAGFSFACDEGCEALYMLGVEEVFEQLCSQLRISHGVQ